MAHRALGFSETDMTKLFTDAGLTMGPPLTVAGPLPIRLWPAFAPAPSPQRKQILELAL
jgi:hypothetical protein